MNRERSIVTDLTLGALAGVVATLALDKATTVLYERQSEEASEREKETMDGKTAYGVAAEKAAGMAGRELTEKEETRYGNALHWGLGIGAGAVYGIMRSRVPWAPLGFGALYGAVFWLVVDEGANTALGLTPAPREFPWESHARGLAGHLVFGIVAEAALRAADALLPHSAERASGQERFGREWPTASVDVPLPG